MPAARSNLSTAGKPRLRLLSLAMCALLAACSQSVELFSGLNEADANEITAALLVAGISGRKEHANKQGFIVKVAEKDMAASIGLLRERGLPRSSFTRMGEIFKKDGMISTPIEERARYIYALSQELEYSLTQIDGVVMARVHPVLPERFAPGEPVQPSSCAVLIKHRPDWDADAYEERIRRLVVAGIPGLEDSPRKVSVVFVATRDVTAKPGFGRGAASVAAAQPSGGEAPAVDGAALP